MPGQASKFIDRTVIVIPEKSGLGKTTLASFISDHNGRIASVSSDSLFRVHRYMDKGYVRFLKDHDHAYRHIDKLSTLVDHKYADCFTDFIVEQIKFIFQQYPQIVLIFVEGYTIKFPNCQRLLLYKLKNENIAIRAWALTNIYVNKNRS